ncbi:hypothetical protein ECG_02054 [Echinococcus granulosus]|uniref:DEDD_Tnp_IS110 domain-containing protein n=1 Tax=Echinococcus granulosus TaxID=6210 RepID=U6FTW1_ECHGR|nr:hypothetical protein ECG_02054 [Echinococcus granulosus]CDI70115.1 hypothetical protein EgrG_002051900 [Echinococcus granulosus]
MESTGADVPKKTDEDLFAALGGTVLDLRMADSKLLDAARTKLEMLSLTGDEMICLLVRRVTNHPFAVHKAQDASVWRKRITNQQDVIATQKSLKSPLCETATLEEMIITWMHLSDLLGKINRHLSDLSLVNCDGGASPPRFVIHCDTSDQM